MKTPNTILNFTQQSWMSVVKQLQRLQADVSSACIALGVPQAAECELRLEQGTLHLKTSAALATRLRQIEPELKTHLNQRAWNIARIDIAVVRSARILASHLATPVWINPNLARFGPRTVPNAAQKAVLARFMPKRRRVQA
jgi:hypothetical protein